MEVAIAISAQTIARFRCTQVTMRCIFKLAVIVNAVSTRDSVLTSLTRHTHICKSRWTAGLRFKTTETMASTKSCDAKLTKLIRLVADVWQKAIWHLAVKSGTSGSCPLCHYSLGIIVVQGPGSPRHPHTGRRRRCPRERKRHYNIGLDF